MDPSMHRDTTAVRRQEPPGLVIATKEVLVQGLGMIASVGEQFSQVVPNPFDSSIGQHYRHVLEHFQCLLEGSASGVVNYDLRARNTRIEGEPDYAVSATRDVLEQIEGWTEQTLQQRCSTVSAVAYHSDDPSSISSNLGRELAYCIGHAIHHYAIIRLLCSQMGVQVPAVFGYAPSTLKSQSSAAAD